MNTTLDDRLRQPIQVPAADWDAIKTALLRLYTERPEDQLADGEVAMGVDALFNPDIKPIPVLSPSWALVPREFEAVVEAARELCKLPLPANAATPTTKQLIELHARRETLRQVGKMYSRRCLSLAAENPHQEAASAAAQQASAKSAMFTFAAGKIAALLQQRGFVQDLSIWGDEPEQWFEHALQEVDRALRGALGYGQ